MFREVHDAVFGDERIGSLGETPSHPETRLRRVPKSCGGAADLIRPEMEMLTLPEDGVEGSGYSCLTGWTVAIETGGIIDEREEIEVTVESEGTLLFMFLYEMLTSYEILVNWTTST